MEYDQDRWTEALIATHVAVELFHTRDAAFATWTKATAALKPRPRNQAKAEKLENAEADALREMFIVTGAFDVAWFRASELTGKEYTPVQRFGTMPPLYLSDHLRQKTNAPLRVIVGALGLLRLRTIDIQRVMLGGRKIDGAQIRRRVAQIRRRVAQIQRRLSEEKSA